MRLPSGTLLGPYEILSPLGAGGMGEVYRARDSRLAREVALKILPRDFAPDSDRPARFEREARAAGQIHHPNILAILDIGTYDGLPFIVTELLEGETLRERTRPGPLAQRKAVEIASQIAKGLGAAHERGIVHRDIKPENIFIGSDGHVKILDFGLASVSAQESSQPDATVTLETASGIILGTAAYMSPEQARGQAVDSRSDIFSLGCVLYEMLSGQRPFSGNTYADLISAILRQDAAPIPSERKILPALERIVRRCVEKSPGERFQSARDLAFQLDSFASNIESGSDKVLPGIAAEQRNALRLSRVFPWVAIPLIVLATAALAWWFRGWQLRTAHPPEVEFERLTDFSGMEESPAISPDGKSVAFVSDSTGSRQIWIRLFAGGVPFQLTHDAGEHLSPRWSPDSASLYYYTPPAEGSHEAVVWEISALGGTPRRLIDSLSEVDPSHDGQSLAFFRLRADQIELVRTDRDASHPQVLAQFPSRTACRQPRWSPDDSSIAFMLATDRWADDLYYVSAAGGTPRRTTFDAWLLSGFSWLPGGSGFVLSSSRGSTFLYLPTMHLWQIGRDGGETRQLTFGDESDMSPDIDSRGRLVSSRIHLNFDIWKFPVAFSPAENVHRAERVSHQTAQVQTPSLSPEGRQLVYLSDTGGHGNLWVLDLASGRSRQITFEKDPSVIMGVPVWSPDGAKIAYARQIFGQGTTSVAYWTVRPDGSDNHEFLAKASWLTWSPDRRWVYYVALADSASGLTGRILKESTSGSAPMEVRQEVTNGPAISPDGSTLYYAKLMQPVNGLWDYEIRSAQPDSGPSRLLAPISGHRVPAWQGFHPVLSPDGKWLALTLNDTFGTNLWLLATADGKMQPVTDFGDRRTFIARHVTWSPDNKFIFAAVGEGDADIVFFEGLVR